MYRNILVGYDGSEQGRKAFGTALELARRDDATLHVVAVARPPEIGDDVESEAVIENSLAYHRELLDGLKSEARSKQVRVRFEVAVGHPAEQIVYAADRCGADLVVVGDRGRSKVAKLLLGSVSKHVTEHAGRPVLVVR
ncbi:MAG TPA: universal stress protein [Burkholderiales bacterium]|nr:universal stress protein [Burkholderiales bacterium]